MHSCNCCCCQVTLLDPVRFPGAIKVFAREICRNDLLNFGRLHFFFPDSRWACSSSSSSTFPDSDVVADTRQMFRMAASKVLIMRRRAPTARLNCLSSQHAVVGTCFASLLVQVIICPFYAAVDISVDVRRLALDLSTDKTLKEARFDRHFVRDLVWSRHQLEELAERRFRAAQVCYMCCVCEC
jgi:hypothetical protein